MSRSAAQPTLYELMARYLGQRADAHVSGLTGAPVEVEPFEAATAQPVDARLAWEEATAALLCAGSATKQALSPPPDWAILVAGHEPVIAVPFCIGNFPQLLRNLQSLLQATDLTALRPQPGRPTACPALLDWCRRIAEKGSFPDTLFALGALRLAKQFDHASELLNRHKDNVPAEWRDGWANEEAALAWHRGKPDHAARLWQAQASSVPVLFNRGIAELFAGKPTEARAPLSKAVEQIPEENAWHHLGLLYLALAEARS